MTECNIVIALYLRFWNDHPKKFGGIIRSWSIEEPVKKKKKKKTLQSDYAGKQDSDDGANFLARLLVFSQ